MISRGGKSVAHPRIMGRGADRFIAYIEHKPDLNKTIFGKSFGSARLEWGGITELPCKYSNGLELQFHDFVQLHGYFSDMSVIPA